MVFWVLFWFLGKEEKEREREQRWQNDCDSMRRRDVADKQLVTGLATSVSLG